MKDYDHDDFICKKCGSKDFTEILGIIICRECGTVWN
jgi:ribosomal protein L37AE/L43A